MMSVAKKLISIILSLVIMFIIIYAVYSIYAYFEKNENSADNSADEIILNLNCFDISKKIKAFNLLRRCINSGQRIDIPEEVLIKQLDFDDETVIARSIKYLDYYNYKSSESIVKASSLLRGASSSNRYRILNYIYSFVAIENIVEKNILIENIRNVIKDVDRFNRLFGVLIIEKIGIGAAVCLSDLKVAYNNETDKEIKTEIERAIKLIDIDSK